MVPLVADKAELNRQAPEFIQMITPPKSAQAGQHTRGSTWQSLMRQTGSVETEFLNGEAVRLAGKLGKKAPINEKITEICTEMAANREKPGKYTPAELGELLDLQPPA